VTVDGADDINAARGIHSGPAFTGSVIPAAADVVFDTQTSAYGDILINANVLSVTNNGWIRSVNRDFDGGSIVLDVRGDYDQRR
jgi:hypothetical protein